MTAAPPLHPNEQTLRAYGLGQLAEDAAAGVDTHLERCPDCRRRVADLSGDSFLSRLRGSARDIADTGAAANDAALPPELANQYELVRELGRGGMGVVWLARNKLLDRLEALKILNRAMLERRGTLDRFLREIRVVAQLNHENVVRAYSAVQVGDALVFVLEYVEGLDLARLVKSKGPLPVAHACYFAYQAALGLQHAHERGMVHRDIKPGNLILHKRGQRAIVKVLDFGLAKALSEQSVDGSLTHEGQMLGTPDYIAPEQTLDAQKADIRADIYSLGCTLYYLLSGAPPFSGTSLYDVLHAHHSEDARPLNLVRPEVPAPLAAIVARMMAKDPLRRFQTPKEVSQALTPFFKSPPAPAPSTAAPANVPPGAARDGDDPPPPASEPKWTSLIEFKETERSDALPARPGTGPAAVPARRRRRWIGPAVAAGVVLLGASIALGVVLRLKTKHGDLELEGLPPGAVVAVDGSTVTLEWLAERGVARARVVAGPHTVTVALDGVEVHGEEVTIAAGAGKRIRIRARPQTVASAAPPQPRSRVESLFNGRDLSGWKDLLENGSQWEVVDGAIQGRGGGASRPAVLVLEGRRLTNFTLRFRAHYARPGGGWVELRRTASGELGLNTSCYAVSHGARTSDAEPTGSAGIARDYEYGTAARGDVIGTVERLATGRWHSFELRVENYRISTIINGNVASGLTDADELYPSGTIALAVSGLDEARFRDIEIEEIPDEALPEPRSAIQGQFAALFNGKDLSGWTDLLPNGSTWTVTEGVIEGRGGGYGNPGVLVLDNQRFTNFRLRFQVRYPENGFGWVELRRSGTEATDGCYAVAHAVLPGYAPVGSVIRTEHAQYGQRREKWDYEPARTDFAPGEWHRFLITVDKNRVTTSVDGLPVGDYVDPDAMHQAGTIGLACGAVDTTVQYKDILIETLPDDPAGPKPTAP